ncbi:MAG: DUF2752 domain-containing protein [Lachnospiraceae bacterium]
MARRFRELCIKTGIILAIGLGYALICMITGRVWIPCLFHLYTGLYCPGCGISRMCLALLRWDLQSAFQANAAVMLLAPLGISVAGVWAFRYVKTGETRLGMLQKGLLCFMVVVLILFGIMRNLPAFACLAPC